MKVDELKVGETYKCVLSDKRVLVIQNERVTKDKDGKEVKEPVLYGKSSEILDNGTANYKYDELFDGQLETLN